MEVVEKLLPAARDQYDELCGWVLRAAGTRPALLDVGSGSGTGPYLPRLVPAAGRLVGVDPDPKILTNPHLQDRAVATVEDFAARSGGSFDAALAVYVVEHLDRPVPFLEAVRHCLAPGGSLFGITPNLCHYFGVSARTAAAFGADAAILRRLRGPELVEDYHVPVRYRLNTLGALRRAGARAGFRRLEVRFLDNPGHFVDYFPPSLRPLPGWYSRGVTKLGARRLCGTLLFELAA